MRKGVTTNWNRISGNSIYRKAKIPNGQGFGAQHGSVAPVTLGEEANEAWDRLHSQPITRRRKKR